MTNYNIIQYGTQITDLGIMIGRCSLNSQHGRSNGILQMLVNLISGTQTMTEVTTQFRDTGRRNEQGKATKMCLTVKNNPKQRV